MKLARSLSLIVTLSLALALGILYPLELISDKVFKDIVPALIVSFILSETLGWREYKNEIKETLEKNLKDYKYNLLIEIRHITNSITNKDVIKFNSSQETYEYITKKSYEAKTNIIDVTLGPRIYKKLENIPEYRQKFAEAKKNIITKNKINYRHIAVVDDISRLKRIKEELNYSTNYSVGILNDTNEVPKLSFYIIDNKEVIIGGLKMYDKTTTSQEIAVSNPVIINLFIEYFNLIWNKYCQVIHDQETKNKIISEIENKLTNTNQTTK